jgi:ssDNA-binding Zn-finger/Zn-ribbon topoisomerase 1
MGDILTGKQKLERLGGSRRITLALLFPCPVCGHANRPARDKPEGVKMYLRDDLPPCRRCGSMLRRANFDRSTIPDPLLRYAEADLGRQQVVRCAKCAQELRLPTNRGRVNLRCPKCKAEFQFSP